MRTIHKVQALYVDAVVSNPPYSQQWDPADNESDARYSRFGLAPKTKADFAFLLHDLYHLKPDGIMTIVLPHGVLFRGGEEGEIRKNLIESDHIDAIIGLPANIFFGTGIQPAFRLIYPAVINSGKIKVQAAGKVPAKYIITLEDIILIIGFGYGIFGYTNTSWPDGSKLAVYIGPET